MFEKGGSDKVVRDCFTLIVHIKTEQRYDDDMAEILGKSLKGWL